MPDDKTALLILPAEAGNSLLEVAKLEFEASLQLLLDRACWVTGADSGALALEREGVLTFGATSGKSQHNPGESAAAFSDAIRECISEQTTVTFAESGTFVMAVPIVQDENTAGYIELTSHETFREESAQAASRIAELVAVSLDHQNAAERADRLDFREKELQLPSLWHVETQNEHGGRTEHLDAITTPNKSLKVAIPEVKACAVCGFPVSPGRSVCVECEQKPDVASFSKDLFTTEPQESWLSSHGYTIASLLVTAVTAAIILWLRH